MANNNTNLSIINRRSRIIATFDNKENWVHISDLFVDKTVRLKGVATSLLQQIIDKSTDLGADYISLDNCLEDPESKLYTNLGFKYKDPSDNEMIKEIKSR